MTEFMRPVKAKLMVHLDNGEKWEATPDDLAKFGYVDRIAGYARFSRHLCRLLVGAGLLGENEDATDARLNPLRHLVEVAVVYPDVYPDLNHPEMAETNAEVVAIERTLRDHQPEEAR